MTLAAHATRFADTMVQQSVVVEQNVRLAQDTYRLRFRCPEIARQIVPGQFIMLRLHACDDPLIGRPLALYDTFFDSKSNSHSSAAEGIDVVYLVKGKLTTRLERVQPGERVDVWGPLGNGFPIEPVEHLIMVAGGIGQTPFVALTREYLCRRTYGNPPRSREPICRQVTLCYGARSKDLLAGLDDFADAGATVRIATDDGSRGRAGLVTDLLQEVLDENPRNCRIACCGPEPMMAATARIADRYGVPCRVSLETPMACGIGICFTCVAKVRDGDHWDYRRTCVEGPVFNSQEIDWT